MSKRSKFGLAAGLIAAIVVALWWHGRGARRAPSATSGPRTTAASATSAAVLVAHASDPRTQPRGGIAGTVRDSDQAPIVGAQVCTTWSGVTVVDDDTRVPHCKVTDAAGRYRFDDLVPARHTLMATAPTFQPAFWRDPARDAFELRLRAGEVREGIDIVLKRGGVAVSGVVEDVSGGPVAGARVTTGAVWAWKPRTGGVLTDAAGKFTVWTAPGDLTVTASADGYADGVAAAAAPSSAVAIYLTPESSLSGIVVTAGDRRPVAGAIVDSGGSWGEGSRVRTRSDEQGRFRLEHLAPGRYKPVATGEGWYGEPVESALLGLGQEVAGVEIVVAPAVRVAGVVVVDAPGEPPCAEGMVTMNDRISGRGANAKIEDGGAVVMTAVRPGHYDVEVSCEDHVSLDHYDPIDVADRDVVDRRWQVRPGSVLRGTVTNAQGAPVADAELYVDRTGADARAQQISGSAISHADGTYRVAGLVPGRYNVDVAARGERAIQPSPIATVPDHGDGVLDLVMPASGEIAGTVVDTEGAPVAGAQVSVAAKAWSASGRARSGDDGSFVLTGVEPGTRRVTASRGWREMLRRPGSSDDDKQGTTVKVVAGQRASVSLVVESERGTIAGVVRDDHGAPVGDAWINATRESDAAGAAAGRAMRASRWSWGSDRRPIVTAVDGRFTVDRLAPGRYTVRAFRKGGGEAVTEHVEVGTTDTVLTIVATGSIAGTVGLAGGKVPDEFDLSLLDESTGVRRAETFYRTDGRFALRDLPTGTFVVTASAAGARQVVTIALGSGEDKTGVRFELVGNLTVRGRFVALDGGAPVSGLKAYVTPVKGDGGGVAFGFGSGGDRADISDAEGRFTVVDAPPGLVYINGFPEDFVNGYGFTRWVTEIAGAGTIDLGDIPVPKRRFAPGDDLGDLGMTFVEPVPGQDPRQRELKVSHVTPGGAAASAGIVVGDVVTAIDSYDVRGARSGLSWALLRVKAGTRLALTLARGDTVTITPVAEP